ncbi:MAG: hypothetical protein KGJ13_11995 [Patescibacteria group bacterium]|nr:hypothetical protein [Patescibacteria group bacterium]
MKPIRAALIPLSRAAKIAGFDVVYLRKLCAERKVSYTRVVGRYYMTRRQIADLIVTVDATK